MSELVTLEVDDRGVAALTLQRPRAGNAFDAELARAWAARTRELTTTPGIRVVVLSGSGPNFCVGGDLGWMAEQEPRREALAGLADLAHQGVRALASLDAPVVAKVRGAAAGIGLSFVAGTDLAIADETSSFTLGYLGVGLSPDGGASWWLPRLVGHRRAADLVLTNRRVKAEEAERIGLVTRVVAADELDATVDDLVARLAAGPTAAYGAARRLLARSAHASLPEQLEDEARSLALLADAPTGREGIAAFVAKRRPEFPAD